MCGRGSLVTDVVVVFLGFHFFFFSMLTVGNIDRHLVQPCTGVEGGVRAWHRASLAEWIRWNFSYLVSQATGGVLHRVSLVERLIRATDHMNMASHRPDRACQQGTNQTLRFPFSSKMPV